MFTVLVTGANKGIGRGFIEHYLQRPNVTLIATVRDPTSPEAASLSSLPRGPGSNIILAKIDNTSKTDSQTAVQSLAQHGVGHLDIAIANAGIYTMSADQPVSSMKPEDLTEHLEVNTIGMLRLYQATLPLMSKATKPVFLLIGAGAATTGGMEEYIHFPLNSYTASKAAANFLMRRIHFENENIISLTVHPGSVITETRRKTALHLGVPEEPPEGISVKHCVTSIISLLDKATRESSSGKFLDFEGTTLVW